MNTLTFAIAALATYRLTLLATRDTITQPIRTRLDTRALHAHRPTTVFLSRLLDCPWCTSIWLAPIFIATAWWWSTTFTWTLVCGSLAASAVTGYLATYAQPE